MHWEECMSLDAFSVPLKKQIIQPNDSFQREPNRKIIHEKKRRGEMFLLNSVDHTDYIANFIAFLKNFLVSQNFIPLHTTYTCTTFCISPWNHVRHITHYYFPHTTHLIRSRSWFIISSHVCFAGSQNAFTSFKASLPVYCPKRLLKPRPPVWLPMPPSPVSSLPSPPISYHSSPSLPQTQLLLKLFLLHCVLLNSTIFPLQSSLKDFSHFSFPCGN